MINNKEMDWLSKFGEYHSILTLSSLQVYISKYELERTE